jgi:hypothetical protein
MNFVNLTPHSITIRRADGTEIHVPPDGTVARVVMHETVVSVADGVAYVRRVAGKVIGLPKHADGIDNTTVAVLVSSIVLAAVPGRANTYAPDTGPSAIRDANGHVVAVTRLVCA